MLGVSLLFVGILLVSNGVLFLSKSKSIVKNEDGTEKVEIVPLVVKSPKSIAFFNIIVAGILVVGNIISLGLILARGGGFLDFQNVAAGLIFGLTYIFIAGNLLAKLDGKPFGIFCGFASIFAIVATVDNFINLHGAGSVGAGIDFLILALLWISWFVLWFSGFLQFICRLKKMDKIFPWISIVVGLVGAFAPALALLFGWWGLL